MDFLKFNKKYYCGVDLHAKSIYVCLMDYKGKVFIHRKFPSDPATFINVIEKYKDEVVVGAESTFNWYWLADACRDAGIQFALGNAYYMKAIHGGKKKNDKIDSKTLAELLRSGMFPPAYAYPKELRATRDLLRRRHHFVMKRAELYRHIELLYYQQGMKAPSVREIKKKSQMENIINVFNEPDIRFSLESDFKLIITLNETIRTIENQIYAQAKQHNHRDFNILTSTPGLGEISAFNILYEIDSIHRFPTVQKFSSFCRVVKGKHISGGKTYRSKNNKIGNPYLKWTMSEIAVHAVEFSPRIKEYYNKLLKKNSKGKAKIILAHRFAIVIYNMLKNRMVFDENKFVS